MVHYPALLWRSVPKNNTLRCLLALLLCGLHLFSANVFAAEKVLDVSQMDTVPVSLTEHFAVLEDPGGNLTLSDVQQPDLASRFKGDQPPTEALSFGFTRSAYWLRFTLHNSGDHPVERMLEIGNAVLTAVQFNQPALDGSYQSQTTGYALPFATRPYPHRFYVFPVVLPAHTEQVLYLRIQSSDGLVVPGRLWTPSAFQAYERKDNRSQSLYFGMAIAMILFNLLLFLVLRDKTYLLYVSFVSFMALTIAARTGLAQELLWPKATLWSDIAHFVGYSLCFATFLIFMRSMLDTKMLVPRIDRHLNSLVGLLLLTPVGMVVSLQTFALPAVLLYAALALLAVGVGLFGCFKRQRSAYFFTAAFLGVAIGGVISIMRAVGLLPTNILTTNGIQFGSALEMILLAFGLGDRINQIRQE